MLALEKKPRKKKPVDPNAPPKLAKHWRDLQALVETTGSFDPGPENPLCKKCGLDTCGAKNKYMDYAGSETPTLTIILPEVSKKEDHLGEIGSDGPARLVMRNLVALNADIGADLSQVRFVSATLCANLNNERKSETGAKWCRHFAVADLMSYRPQVIMPVGTAALGLLSHKSNAGDWSGRTLTYRGWPDDWVTEPKFDLEHPLFGPKPGQDARIVMVPVQAPKLVYGTRNPRAIKKWHQDLKNVLIALRDGVKPLVYDCSWWTITTDKEEVKFWLEHLINLPTKVVLTYDTETTGLEQWKEGAKIVFMMLRWHDPTTGEPRAIGWPWEYETSEMLPYLAELGPLIMLALSLHRLQGHNLTFDVLFSLANIVPDGFAWINRLCEAMYRDTLHMAYVSRQSKGSLGLELLAYDYAPQLAGYEEEFVLLTERTPAMQPDQGGHYANCPKPLWDSHLRPYVMGDVEVCAVAAENLETKLLGLPNYRIPLSNPAKLGSFRLYSGLSRHEVYYSILGPAASVLTKMMARGMYVNQEEVATQEVVFPKLINEAKEVIKKSSPKVEQWCKMQEATDPEWALDLENKTALKTILFELMDLPIKTLTDSGMERYKNTVITTIPREELLKYASTSKFTLSNLSVEFEAVRKVLEYRTLHKAYTSFVRPMRNITTEGIDKKERKKSQYIQRDGLVHSSFKITGTTTGRLASANPNLQNLPRESAIKSMYQSRFGKLGCIYQADKSQIELRLLACASGDPAMVNAYLNDIDLHSQTTSLLFDIPYDRFGDEYTEWLQKNDRSKEAKDLKTKRKVGKTANFLTGYGGGAKGLQTSLAIAGLYMTEEECQKILDKFFGNYSTLQKHISVYKTFVQQYGCAVSLFGRVRPLEDAFSEDMGLASKATRQGYNHLIQSSACDMMLLALVAIEQLMCDAGLESLLVSTVHDSLVIDAKIMELPQIHEICCAVMNNMPTVMRNLLGDSYDLSWAYMLPFEADMEVGHDYLNSKAIPKSGAIDWDALLTVKS